MRGCYVLHLQNVLGDISTEKEMVPEMRSKAMADKGDLDSFYESMRWLIDGFLRAIKERDQKIRATKDVLEHAQELRDRLKAAEEVIEAAHTWNTTAGDLHDDACIVLTYAIRAYRAKYEKEGK